MGSSRLPNKVLMDINGTPSLKFMIDRVYKSKILDKVVVATTLNEQDDEIVEFCLNNNISCFRGSENDVLDRYYKTAKEYNAETIIRLTSDCPLIDPELIDETIHLFTHEKVDYAANAVPPELKKYPDGSDVEVFSFKALKNAWTHAKDLKDREHVTFYLWNKENDFTTAMLNNEHDWGKYRITVDYKEDLKLVRKIAEILKVQNKFGYTHEIIEILKENKELFDINSMHTWGTNW